MNIDDFCYRLLPLLPLSMMVALAKNFQFLPATPALLAATPALK
jgi:hypothetical protein